MGMPSVLFPAEQQALGASENWRMQDQENEQPGALTQHTSASMRGSIPPLLLPFCAEESPEIAAGKGPEISAGEMLAICAVEKPEDPPENSLIPPENMVFESILRPHPPAVELGKGGVVVALNEDAGSCAAPRAQGTRNNTRPWRKFQRGRSCSIGSSTHRALRTPFPFLPCLFSSYPASLFSTSQRVSAFSN